MRIVTILALPLLVAAAPASQSAPKPAKPVCQNTDVLNVNDPKPASAIHPLREEPPARQVLTVLRSIDGCSRPVIVGDMIGATPQR